MSKIVIEGLSKRQRVFADVMWGLNGREQVERFIQSLPLDQKKEAQTTLEMMVAAVFDDVANIQQSTRDLLDKVSKP